MLVNIDASELAGMLKHLARSVSVEDMNPSPDWIDVLTAEGWEAVQLGNGPSADCGAGRACSYDGADEPAAHSGGCCTIRILTARTRDAIISGCTASSISPPA
jgi:hypothetical protein